MAKAATAAGSLVITVVVARVLGPEGRGEYAAALALAALGVQLGSAGLGTANTYFAAKGGSDLGQLLGNSLLASFVGVAVVTAAAGVLLVSFEGLSPVATGPLLFALLWVPIGTAYLFVRNLILGLHRIRIFNLLDIGRQSVIVVGVVLLALAGVAEVSTYVGIAWLGLSLALAAAVWFVWSAHGASPRVSLELLLHLGQYGFRAYLATLFSFIVLKSDVLMVQYMLGSGATGQYSIAVALGEVLYMLPVAVGQVLFPGLSSMTSETEKTAQSARVALVVGLVTLGAGIVLAIVASPLVDLVFGQAYLPSVPALLVLIPGIVFFGVSTVLMNYMASRGLPWYTVWVSGGAAALNLAANFVLIPSLGIMGAAIASTLAYLAMLIANVFYIVQAFGGRGSYADTTHVGE